MVTIQPMQEVHMRDEAEAFAVWLRAGLNQRYDVPEDLPVELMQLIDTACTRS